MAEICPVCEKKVGWDADCALREAGYGKPRLEIHESCLKAFDENPELYGGTSVKQREKENSETIKIQKEATEQKRKEREDKSVYVKGFNMPFEEMVIFMVKCALASIPAFIILAIIGGIFFLIFAAIFS